MNIKTLLFAVLTPILLSGCTDLYPEVDTATIQYPYCWSGNLSDDNGSRSIEGCGTESFPVEGFIVSVVAQKSDDSPTELCVELLNGNASVSSQCTTAGYGLVSITN